MLYNTVLLFRISQGSGYIGNHMTVLFLNSSNASTACIGVDNEKTCYSTKIRKYLWGAKIKV